MRRRPPKWKHLLWTRRMRRKRRKKQPLSMQRLQPLRKKRRRMPALLLSTPRLLLPLLRNWSRSGGPAAARKNAGRVTTATVPAITTGRRFARN